MDRGIAKEYEEFKEHREFDKEFNTDRGVAKRHIAFQFKGDREDEEYKLQGCCAQCSEVDAIWKSSSHSHNSGDCTQGAMKGWMTGSSDDSYCPALTDPWRKPCTMPSAVRSTPSLRST